MKRSLLIFFMMVLLALAFFQFFYKEQFDLIAFVRNRVFGNSEVATTPAKPKARKVDTIAEIDSIANSETPKWFGDQSKNKLLKLQYVIGGTQGSWTFRKAIDVEFGSGEVYVLDYGNKSVEMFSAGNHKSTLGITTDHGRVLRKPTDLAVMASGTVLVSDSESGLVFIEENSVSLVKLKYEIDQIAVGPQDEIYCFSARDRYLLHELNTSGQEILTFAKQRNDVSALSVVFNAAVLAIDANSFAYLSTINPYRITKYSNSGEPIIKFARDLGVLINPPTIVEDKSGGIKQVIRQEITYDIAVGADGLIYNLVRTQGLAGGNLLDVFSRDGEFLQTFYLEENAIAIAMFQMKLAFLSPGRNQAVKVYNIEAIQ